MSIPKTYSYIRYLAAKKTIDDRSLNHAVRKSLQANLATLNLAEPLKILELGSGIGTMIERFFSWELLSDGHYLCVDIDQDSIEYSKKRIVQWVSAQGWDPPSFEGESLCVDHDRGRIKITFQCADASQFVLDRSFAGKWDLIVANAFMDLIDLTSFIPVLVRLIRPGGLLYLTLNFDGITSFLPVIDEVLDAQIERLYHQSMDRRSVDGQPSGDSQTGRKLLTLLPASGVDLLAAGASDWVVHPKDGTYVDDEAYFLHFIINTVAQELEGHTQLDPTSFQAWVNQRHNQIESSNLVYIAHQLDLLGRVQA